MPLQDILDILIKIIREDVLESPDRKLDEETPLISSGLIDSFRLVDLSLVIEETFNVHIEDYELNADTFDTVEQLATIIYERSHA